MTLQVAFDISELCSSQNYRHGRRGISRVVEEVCSALLSAAAVGANGLNFKVTSVESSAAAAAYIDSPDGERVNSATMLGRPAHRLWTAIGLWSDLFVRDNADRALTRRALRRLINRTLPWQRAVAHKLRALDPETLDVFHSPALTPMPAYVLRAKRPACFLTVYDLIPFLLPSLVDAVSISQLKAVLAPFRTEHFAICISHHVKDEFCEYIKIDPSRVFVAPLAADAARFYPCTDNAQIASAKRRCQLPDSESPYFLSLCAVEPRKNLLHLIGCFARLRREDPAARDLRLVLVGHAVEKNLRAVKSLVASEKMENHVVITGYVEDSDLAPLYSGALAFVFPSLAEGFGLPPLEAMQCGVPVICSNRTSLPEVVGDAGLLIDPEDGDALCAAMQRIFHDEPLQKDLFRRGLARAKKFSWSRCAEDHLNAYRTAVEMKGGRTY